MKKTFESRSYQTRIHNKSIQYLESDNKALTKTLMIESPTGSGKTVMGTRLAKHLADQGHKIGWIAHRKELLEQAAECNRDFFQVDDIKYISLFTRTPEDYKDRTVIIVDESQHDAAKSAAVLHEVIKPEIIIGLTATPYRTDKAQLCFQKVIRDAGIHQLIREKFLAEFNQYIFNEEWTPKNVARYYLNDKDLWGKSVIYFLSTDDAVECAAILKENGVRADYIIGSEPREEALHKFKTDELEVLTNVAVLTEGFDEPSLKTAFVRPSSKGPTVQMAGRAFRKHPEIPICNIVQNKDTKYPFTKHASANNQFIYEDGKWKSISAQNLNPILVKQRHRVAMAKVEMPTFIKMRTKRKYDPFSE